MAKADATISQLREESERTRAALSTSALELRSKIGATVTEIKTLVSPSHIKGEVKSYVRESGTNFIESMTDRARENPLQALAAGAAVAVPLIKVLRTLPLPLVMIGAGFWLTSKSGRETLSAASEKASDTLETASRQASNMMASVTDATADLKETAVNRVSDAASSVISSVQPAIDKGRATINDVRDATTGLVRAASEMSSSARDGVSASGSVATRSVAVGVSGMAETMSDSAGKVADRVRDAGVRSQQSVTDFVHSNPLLTAAIGVAAGAFLAAAFPVTSTEQKAFGDQSARVKRAGRDAVSRGIDAAAETADDAVRSVALAAEREGLSADGIGTAFREVADKAKAVVEKGIQSVTNASAPVHGEK